MWRPIQDHLGFSILAALNSIENAHGGFHFQNDPCLPNGVIFVFALHEKKIENDRKLCLVVACSASVNGQSFQKPPFLIAFYRLPETRSV